MTQRNTDWEAIEREYRAGQLSVRQIASSHALTEGAIRKRAKAEGWTRALADKVRDAVREKLVRADGTQQGTQAQRADDAGIIDLAAGRGFEVVTSHRRDLTQLHGLKRIIADRLSTFLQGGQPDGPFMGDKESPGDLLEKLARVTARLIPLERQAHNLDEESSGVPVAAAEMSDPEFGRRAAFVLMKAAVQLDDVLARISGLAASDRKELVSTVVKATSTMPWVPNPGPQTEAFFTIADETFYGGQAGGGKTDLAVGLSLTEHKRSLILRRINKDAVKIVARYEAILGHRDGYNGQLQRWRLNDKQIDIAGCEQESDKQRFKGDPHDLIVFDEGTDFLESQYRFIIGWNRSTDPDQRCRILVTSNPPTTRTDCGSFAIGLPGLTRRIRTRPSLANCDGSRRSAASTQRSTVLVRT